MSKVSRLRLVTIWATRRSRNPASWTSISSESDCLMKEVSKVSNGLRLVNV